MSANGARVNDVSSPSFSIVESAMAVLRKHSNQVVPVLNIVPKSPDSPQTPTPLIKSSTSSRLDSITKAAIQPDMHKRRASSVGRALNPDDERQEPLTGSLGRIPTKRGSMVRSGTPGLHEAHLAMRQHQARSSVFVLAENQNHRSRAVLKWAQLYHQRKRIVSLCFPIVDPKSGRKLIWDSIIIVIVLYSAIIVPIEVGFPDIDLGTPWQIISMIAAAIFFLDVVQNFFVGYYENDDEAMVTDRKAIAVRYLNSWFLLDLLAVMPTDYIIDLMHADNQSKTVASLKLTRMIRLVRVTKLVRLLKLNQFIMKIEDELELDSVLTRMTQLIGQVLLMTHLLSCFWHLIGYSQDAGAITWIKAAGIEDQSTGVRYLYSFYWVTATIAGVGYGDIHATNTSERIFSAVAEIIGATGVGIIIGNITKILENWNREASAKVQKMSIVQEFIKKKAIPPKLKANILRYFRHYIAKTSAFDERELLCEFSLSLRGEVLHETYKNTFFLIPAFQRLSTQFVMDMAMYIKPLLAVSGDILAKEGSVGTEMFILNEGIVEIKRTAPNGEWIVVLEVLTERGIFGESSLLHYTLHQNSCTAKANCDLYTLPKEDFDRLIEEFPDAEQTLLTYHQERSTLYDRVFEQTLARYRVFLNSRNNDPVSEMVGIENIYPTLTVLLDGVLRSYRSVPIPILQKMTLDLSMGVSVFNSATEKKKMVGILSHEGEISQWKDIKRRLTTPISPDNVYKVRWDILVSLAIVYCAIAIPYQSAFLFDERSMNRPLEICIEIVFAVDLVLNFRTSTMDRKGHLVTSSKEIARAYLRFWFWIDAVSMLPLSTVPSVWVAPTPGSTTSYQQIRVVRLVKLFRVLKIAHVDPRLQTHHATLRVARLVIKVSFITHLLTCGYYFVSVTSATYYSHSLSEAMPTSSHFDIYVFCLYWTVTTMTTVGYGDDSPKNPMEVGYVIFGVMIGASTFTYVIGTVASLVEELHATSDSYRERMDRLKAYLKERNIPKPLATRLRRYYEYYLMQRDDENEDTVLTSLSDNLRSQLVLHLNRDVVSKIAFFATQDDACVSYLMGILDPEFCTPGEYVFKEGQIGRHMYFLVKGVAEILFHAGSSQEVVVATLLEGSYFGEIAMLTMSKRAASIRAKTYISLFVLSRNGLDRISMHYPEMASNIIQEFRKKITTIKKAVPPSPKREDSKSKTQYKYTVLNGGNMSELQETLGDLESIVGRIVAIYGGDERAKRKALTCVIQHLRKFEFSLDDFIIAAEEIAYLHEGSTATTPVSPFSKAGHTTVMLNRFQKQLRRRSSFS